jgi:hypothetical protein
MDVITTMRVIGLQKCDLRKVVTELKEKWKRDIKPGDTAKGTKSKAINVNNSKKSLGGKKKWNSKQLKGTCYTCGKQGHKAANCCSKDGAKETRPRAILLGIKNVIVATKWDILHGNV